MPFLEGNGDFCFLILLFILFKKNSFHLFDETMPFLREMEKKYNFKAEIFQVCSSCVLNVFLS